MSEEGARQEMEFSGLNLKNDDPCDRRESTVSQERGLLQATGVTHWTERTRRVGKWLQHKLFIHNFASVAMFGSLQAWDIYGNNQLLMEGMGSDKVRRKEEYATSRQDPTVSAAAFLLSVKGKRNGERRQGRQSRAMGFLFCRGGPGFGVHESNEIDECCARLRNGQWTKFTYHSTLLLPIYTKMQSVGCRLTNKRNKSTTGR